MLADLLASDGIRSSLPHCDKTQINDNLFMYYTPLADHVMLGLHALEGVNGWSSLALSGNGGMKGAS